MKLSQLGEFGLIDLIKKQQKNRRADTVFGIGDDCAALKTSNSKLQLITTDTLIEGVHFDLRHTSFFDLGYKAMLVNISDIAAMGGVPTHALVTIGVSKDIEVKYQHRSKPTIKYVEVKDKQYRSQRLYNSETIVIIEVNDQKLVSQRTTHIEFKHGIQRSNNIECDYQHISKPTIKHIEA